MKFSVIIFFLILCFTMTSSFAQSKEDETLKSLINKMTDAQINYKPEILDKIFTMDFIEISPLGEFDSREKVLSFYKPELKPPANKISTKVEATDFSIRNYDKFAIVITQLNFTVTNNETKLPPRAMRATIVCRKEKGVWKIASAQYTSIRPQQQQSK